MRLTSLFALAAVPAFVAAEPAWHHRHRNRQPAAWHRRQGEVAERQGGLIGSILSDVLNPGPATSASATSARPTPSASPAPSSSARPSSSAPPRPPSTSAPPSSATPSSSEAPPTSAEPSEAPSPTPTTEAPTTADSEETTAPTTAATTSSSAGPSVKYVTKTIDGQVVTETPTAAAKGNGGIGTGAIVGIAVGAGVVVIAIVAIIIFFARRGRSSSEDDVIRWPELNHHGDAEVQHALPVHQSDKHGLGERRMSLGSELDETPPQYLHPGNDYGHGGAQGGLGGSAFGAAADFSSYDNEKYGYDNYGQPAQHRSVSPYNYDDDNYTSFPPPVQPQPSPVHGVRPDWATDGSYSDGHNNNNNGYATMHRGGSPPMAGVGSGSYFNQPHSPPPMAGVGSGAMSYPPQQPHY